MKSAILQKILTSFGCKSVPASDLALGAAGIGMAGSAAAFAFVMMANTGQAPGVNGGEHLRIFAQPVTIPYTGGKAASVTELAEGSGRSGIDYTPIGSVRMRALTRSREGDEERAAAKASVDDGTPISGFRMRGIFQSEALVQGPNGFQMVKAGTDIEGAGRVTAIEARGRRWVVVTTQGYIAGAE